MQIPASGLTKRIRLKRACFRFTFLPSFLLTVFYLYFFIHHLHPKIFRVIFALVLQYIQSYLKNICKQPKTQYFMIITKALTGCGNYAGYDLHKRAYTIANLLVGHKIFAIPIPVFMGSEYNNRREFPAFPTSFRLFHL
jgi:hypothetical protein